MCFPNKKKKKKSRQKFMPSHKMYSEKMTIVQPWMKPYNFQIFSLKKLCGIQNY